jgi:ADP-ribosyl-[dinitrogen reductase] hydrolase
MSDINEDHFDKILGMIAGLSIGDTIGAAHEFDSNEYTGRVQRYSLNLKWVRRKNATQPTDDTEMSLALLRTFVKDKGYKRDNVVMAYIRWANGHSLANIDGEDVTPMTGMGKNTAKLLKGIKTFSGYESRRKKHSSDEMQSNGTLMRISPMVLLPNGQDLSRIDAAITNSSKVNGDVNWVYVSMLKYLLYGNEEGLVEALGMITTMQDVDYNVRLAVYHGMSGTSESFREAIGLSSFNDKRKGWVLIPLFLSIYMLFHVTDIKEAYRMIITLEEYGGKKSDTDTNSAIVGAVLGIRIGFKEMMKDEDLMYNWDMVRNWHTSGQETDQPRHVDFTLEGIEDLIKESLTINYQP